MQLENVTKMYRCIEKMNIKLTNKERIIIVSPIFIIILVVSFFFKFKQDSENIFYKYVVPDEYHGVIIEKFRRIYQHDHPYIKLQNETKIWEMSVFNWNDLYNKSEVGDSIYKNKGDTVLYVKKKKDNSIITINYFFDKGWSIVKR